ncbi:MAG: DoxX family membrane protein [Caulobacterales bacterium]
MASRNSGSSLTAFAAIGMAAGLCGLGLLSVLYQDFAEVWEPVPKAWPAHAASASVSGLILLAAGVMMAIRRTRPWGAALAAAFLGLWVVVLHLPHALARPVVVASWQSVAESLAMATGAFIACREAKGGAGRIAATVMGVCYVVFGVSHFAYAAFTAAMVPAWLPMRLDFTYLTGAIHVLTGLAIVIGFQRRWAAAAEALMMTSFVLLVHVPRVSAAPHDRMELTALFIAITLSSAAWLLAASRGIAKR